MKRVLALLCLALLNPGCKEQAPECDGITIDPSVPILAFGDLELPPSDEDEGGEEEEEEEAETNTERGTVPAQKTLFLRAHCGQALEIERVCVVHEGHNGDPEITAFEIEGPGTTTIIPGGEEAAIRVTYNARSLNGDLDFDGIADPDIGALIIQSNAVNHPTLAIPLCGRVVNGDAPTAPQRCVLNLDIPQGEKVEDLCGP